RGSILFGSPHVHLMVTDHRGDSTRPTGTFRDTAIVRPPTRASLAAPPSSAHGFAKTSPDRRERKSRSHRNRRGGKRGSGRGACSCDIARETCLVPRRPRKVFSTDGAGRRAWPLT